MNLADVSAFDVARLAAAAALGWGAVSALFTAINSAMAASLTAYMRRNGPHVVRIVTGDDDNTPPGPTAAA